jgi:hypothetical protein
VPSREKPGQWPRPHPSSPFSAVRFAEELSRKMGIFRVFRGKRRRNFSALKTYWRREWDSIIGNLLSLVISGTSTVTYSKYNRYRTLHLLIFVASVAPEYPFFLIFGITGITDLEAGEHVVDPRYPDFTLSAIASAFNGFASSQRDILRRPLDFSIFRS